MDSVVSCPRLKRAIGELFSCEAPSKAAKREESMVCSSIFPAANIVTAMTDLTVKALGRLIVNLLTKLLF